MGPQVDSGGAWRARAGCGAIGALGLLGAVGLLAWGLGLGPWAEVPLPPPPDRPPPIPPLVYQGPFQNVGPAVPYVGDAVCARCHRDIAAAYKGSAMGQSLRPIADVAPLQRYDAQANNPFEVLGYRFGVERQGSRVWHRQSRTGPAGQVLLDFSLEVHHVIGSGTRGYSYLAERDGYLFQTAISWFSQKAIWDKSPGFEPDRFAGRPIIEACLFCHANRAPAVDGYRNRYDHPFENGHAIGCERCHGPGEKHVKEGGVLTAGFDVTIVNPARLEYGLREAVCQQCHLEGKARVLRRGRHLYEFRPGLPLESVLTTFVPPDEAGVRAVSQFEQMHHSQCFRGGQGDRKMGCTSCHDPHRQIAPAERAGFYRKRCMQCHEQHGCSATPAERASRDDRCTDCHMPRFASSDIVHTASTDHRVIRPGRAKPLAPGDDGKLEPFLRRPSEPGDREMARDLGIAFVESARVDREMLRRGAALLEKACSDFPDDLEALDAWATALLGLGRNQLAAEAARRILNKAPRHESALLRYAMACEALGQDQAALDAWRQAVEVNPWLPLCREHLTSLLAKKGSWKELYPHAETWLQLDPGAIEAHKAWIAALWHNGQSGAADAAVARARALHPFNQRELQNWFEELQR